MTVMEQSCHEGVLNEANAWQCQVLGYALSNLVLHQLCGFSEY